MKRTCGFVLSALFTLPVFAATDGANLYEPYKKTMYGTPENTITKTETAQAQTSKTTNADKELTATDENVQSLQEETLDSVDNVQNDISSGDEKTSAENFESYSSSTSSSNPDIKFPHGVQLGLGVSATGGLDGFVGYNNKKFDSFWWKRFGVRLGYASTKPFKSFINKRVDSAMGDGIDIGDYVTMRDGNVEAQHMFALVDFYPFGDTWFFGGLRLSGGYYNGDLKLTADLGAKDTVLTNDAEFKLGDTWYKYTAGDNQGFATAKWSVSGPYAGLGFDLGLFSGFKIYMDAGVVFTTEAAKLDLQIAEAGLFQSTDRTSWTPVDVSGLNSKKAEALASAQHELDKYPYYPIVKLGFMYRF